jgi:hypothetical protein
MSSYLKELDERIAQMNAENEAAVAALYVPDEFGRYQGYYDLGFGVNEAEALRQQLVDDLILTHRCDDCSTDQREVFPCPTHELIWSKVERLAELAGATWFDAPATARIVESSDDAGGRAA